MNGQDLKKSNDSLKILPQAKFGEQFAGSPKGYKDDVYFGTNLRKRLSMFM